METVKNNKRIEAIDFARGVSTAMLVVIHTLWMYGDQATQTNSWVGTIVHFMGKGTGMFLIAMGFSFTLSRNQSLILSFRRGIKLLAVGYGMNFLKFIVPIWAGIMPDNFIEAYQWTVPAKFENMLFLVSVGDILQLAGLSLFLMGIVNHFSKNKYVPLILAVVIASCANFVRGIQAGVEGFDYFLDLLWGTGYNVYFPVFPWVSFILTGIFIGRVYLESERDQAFTFKQILQYGLVFLAAGGVLCIYNFKYHFGDFFHLGPGGTIYLIGFSLLLTWFAKFIVSKVPANKIFDFIFYMSKRVTSFYIIQWVLICWGMGVLGFQTLNAMQVLLMMPVMMALSLLTQRLWDKIKPLGKAKKIEKKEEKKKEEAVLV